MQFYYVKMCNSTLITIIIINFPDKKEVEAGAASRMRIEFNYLAKAINEEVNQVTLKM